MNIISMLDRLTEPEFVASPVKSLSRAEIEALQSTGEITPLEQIPRAHMEGRVSMTPKFGRGTYSGCSYYGFRGQL
jgi:hypothetical protein